MASIQRREVERVAVDKATGEKRQVRAVVYRARYRDEGGKEHAGHFQRKVDAQRWLDVSGLGIIVTAASLVVMPVLGVAKSASARSSAPAPPPVKASKTSSAPPKPVPSCSAWPGPQCWAGPGSTPPSPYY